MCGPPGRGSHAHGAPSRRSLPMPHDFFHLPRPRATSAPERLRIALAVLLTLAAAPLARAGEPGVHSDFLNGAVRVTLDGSYAGARYTVQRAEGANQPFRV